MAIEDAIEKIQVWAASESALRTTPEDAGIDRADGWTVEYEQVGGTAPQMRVVQQLIHELTTMIVEARDNGLPLDWDGRVNYIHPAYVKLDGDIYVSQRDNGPALGNAARPGSDNSIWKPY